MPVTITLFLLLYCALFNLLLLIGIIIITPLLEQASYSDYKIEYCRIVHVCSHILL